MTLLHHLEALHQHGVWADARFLEALRAAGAPPASVLRELAHVRGAQEAWHSRIQHRDPTLAVWPDLSLAELAVEGAKVDANYRVLFTALSPATLDQPISYTNSAGLPFTTEIVQILLHVFTHGQYHRGKANVALRAAGVEPVGVDYIAFLRTPAAEEPTFAVIQRLANTGR